MSEAISGAGPRLTPTPAAATPAESAARPVAAASLPPVTVPAQAWSPAAGATVTAQGRLTANGVESAQVVAGFKALISDTKVDTSTGVVITNDKLTEAQFKAAVDTVFGEGASLSIAANGTFTPGASVSPQALANFKELRGAVAVDHTGALVAKPGVASGDLQLKAQKQFGPAVTLSGDGKIVLKDSVVQSAAVNQKLVTRFGESASLTATFKASDDRVKHLRTAEATAAVTALINGSQVTTSGGLSLTRNDSKLTQAQFKSAVETVFGPKAKVSASGTFTYTPESGVSPSLAASFQKVHGNITVDGHGQLTLKEGVASGEVGGAVQRLVGNNAVVVGNNIRFKENSFQSAELNGKLVRSYGKGATLTPILKASVDREGAISAEATAAWHSLINGTTIDVSNGLTVTNHSLTKAQFAAVLKRTLGPKAEASADGSLVWAKGTDGKTITTATAGVKVVKENISFDAHGKVQLNQGVVSGDVAAKLTNTFGTGVTLTSDASATFKGGRVTSATFSEGLKKKFGETASVGATVRTTFNETGLAEVAVGLEAFKQLKQWGEAGHIDVNARGNVVIKDNAVSTAEVEAMLSAASGSGVKLGVGGKVQYVSGKPLTTEFSGNLSKAWGSTTVSADGKVRLVDGHAHASGHVSALFGGPTLKAGADLAFDGTDSLKASAKLSTIRGNRTVDHTASFSRVNGTTTASVQSKLVTTGDSPVGVSVGGLISVSDTEKAASIKSEISAGKLTGALGVGVSKGVKVYTPGPAEPGRREVAKNGGVWAERSTTFDLSASAGANATMAIGAGTLSLGFKAEGGIKREVHTLSLHESKEAALHGGAVTVIRPPESIDAIRAMKPYEQYSDSGTRSVGMSGNVAVSYGIGPASISAGGQVYHQVTGNLARDIERLDGDKVRVRFRKLDGSVDVKSLSASVGLNGSKVLSANALGKAVAPLVESVAQMGFKASVEKTKQNASVIDLTIDLSTERGRLAMERVLQSDLSEAQYWAHYPDSGVKLNASVTTALNVSTKALSANLSLLNAEQMSKWVDKARTEITPDSYSFTQALDYTQKSDHLLPWLPTRMSDVRFLNQRELDTGSGTMALPPVGDLPPAGAPLSLRTPPPEPAPTLQNARALLGVRVKITDAKSSLRDVNDTLGAAVNVMNAVGYEPEAYRRFNDFRQAVSAGIVPEKKALMLGLGDKRFGETTLDLEGYVSPKGLRGLFTNPDGTARSSAEYQRAYLDASALTGAGSVASDGGLRAAIEKKLGASLVSGPNGELSVLKDGAQIGTLSPADFASMRKTIDEFWPPAPQGEQGDAHWYQEIRAKGVGTWVGKPPRSLFDLDTQKWNDVTVTRQRSIDFANAMNAAAALRAENAPGQAPPGPLFDKPDAYFNQLNELFEKTVRNDGEHQTAALTVLTLAGKEGIYARAAFSVPKETTGQMIEVARGTVKRFGAASALAEAQPRLSGTGDFEFATGADPAAAERLAKAMFGSAVKVSSAEGRTTVSEMTMTPERREKLVELLSGGRGADGSLQVPAKWSASQASRFIRETLGAPTVVTDGRIAFDNRGYQGVSIGDALLSLSTEAFGVLEAGKTPTRFPLGTPVKSEAVKQDPNAYYTNMVAKHKGADSAWGSWFDDMALMRSRKADLSKEGIANIGWVLND